MNSAGSLGSGSAGDPRMRGFKTRTSVADLWSWIAASIMPLETEEIALTNGSGRVLARQISSAVAVPPFDRAAMDGYAVRAEETFGASAYTPASFRRIARSRPGIRCEAAVGASETIEIATGAPVPEGADAVVPVESTRSDGDHVLVSDSVPQGRNIGRRGEDIAPGTVVLPAGRVLRPQDLGVLSAIGASRIEVIRRPRVGVVVTGDELLPPGSLAHDFQIPDANSVMIAALVARDGGDCETVGPLPDDRAVILHAIVELATRCDLLLLSGGSSAGPEDHVPGIIAELGTLVAHGLALRPASPTGVGVLHQGERPVVMLPGNPVSCLCAYDFAAGPILRRLAALPGLWPYRRVSIPLARKLSSVAGRVDYTRVRFVDGQAEPIATSGASILSSVSRADGFVVVPAPLEGFPAGARVDVWCYDETSLGVTNPLEAQCHEKTAAIDHSIRSAHQIPLG
jgi:molybdopterin molybdotransferase